MSLTREAVHKKGFNEVRIHILSEQRSLLYIKIQPTIKIVEYKITKVET